MRRMKKLKVNHEYEFDLDLAPLLAVMVKLVPVLLVSSAFVQVMTIETQLPQVVQQAIDNQEKDKNATQIKMEVASKEGVKIIITKAGKETQEVVPATADGKIDLKAVHKRLQAVKAANPEVFKIDISPEDDVTHDDIVHVMDEARRSRDANVRFPVQDKTQNKEVQTDYMFPEVQFANMMEG